MAFKGHDDCLKKGGGDEPVFTLRARDVTAPDVVRLWAVNAASRGVSVEKCREACECATSMERWQEKHGTKLPD